jgi:large subunit ribosomal protein L21
MYAVIKTGGKQYKVAPGALLAVAKLSGEAGDSVAFENVILVGGDEGTTVGSPLVAGATVAGEIVGQKRTAKILVFKKRRRQNSKRSRGHRQDLTLIRITEILTDGKKPAVKKAKAEAPAAEAAPERPAAKPKRAAAKTAEPVEAAAAKPPRSPRKKATTETSDEAEKAKPARKPRAKAAKTDDKE